MEPVRRKEAIATGPVQHGNALSALRHRNFAVFFAALSLANIGYDVQRVGMGLLAYKLSGSAFLLTLVFAGDSLPMLLLSPIGGVVSDLLNRRTLLIVTRTIVGLGAITIALLTMTGAIQLWHLFAYVMVAGTCYAFDVPARHAMLRDLVPEEDFVTAAALVATLRQSSRIIGPALGSALLLVFGTGTMFVVMGLGQLGLVALVATCRVPAALRPPLRDVMTNLRAGLRYVADHEAIWVVLIVSALPAMFAMAYQSLTPVFAEDVLGEGRAAVGVMLAAAGLGAMLGSMVVAARPNRMAQPVMAAITAIGLSLLVAAFALSRLYPLSLALLLGVGAMSAAMTVVTTTTIQRNTPAEMQGRVMGVYQVTWELQVVGAITVGALADLLGAPAALASAGLLSALVVSTLLVRRPVLRQAQA
jgi:MFS family permease